MVRQSHTVVVERNVVWEGAWSTEPYEVAWASEALFFIRGLAVTGQLHGAVGRVQLSPDGIHWVDEGTEIALPAPAAVSFARVQQFGGWLRLIGELPTGTACKMLVYLTLKE